MVTVVNSGGTSAVSPLDQFIYVPVRNPPVVTQVAPGEGPSAGATTVTVTGRNFSGVTAVMFRSDPRQQLHGELPDVDPRRLAG